MEFSEGTLTILYLIISPLYFFFFFLTLCVCLDIWKSERKELERDHPSSGPLSTGSQHRLDELNQGTRCCILISHKSSQGPILRAAFGCLPWHISRKLPSPFLRVLYLLACIYERKYMEFVFQCLPYSLSIIISISFHLVANIRVSFFVTEQYFSIYYIYIPFSHSPDERQLG